MTDEMWGDIDAVSLRSFHFEFDRDDEETSVRYEFAVEGADGAAKEFGDSLARQSEMIDERGQVSPTITSSVSDGRAVVWKHLENRHIDSADFELGELLSVVQTPMEWFFDDKPAFAETLADEVRQTAEYLREEYEGPLCEWCGSRITEPDQQCAARDAGFRCDPDPYPEDL